MGDAQDSSERYRGTGKGPGGKGDGQELSSYLTLAEQLSTAWSQLKDKSDHWLHFPPWAPGVRPESFQDPNPLFQAERPVAS